MLACIESQKHCDVQLVEWRWIRWRASNATLWWWWTPPFHSPAVWESLCYKLSDSTSLIQFHLVKVGWGGVYYTQRMNNLISSRFEMIRSFFTLSLTDPTIQCPVLESYENIFWGLFLPALKRQRDRSELHKILPFMFCSGCTSYPQQCQHMIEIVFTHLPV